MGLGELGLGEMGGHRPGPSSFGRQQWLSEITIEPIKKLGGLGKIWGLCLESLAPT